MTSGAPKYCLVSLVVSCVALSSTQAQTGPSQSDPCPPINVFEEGIFSCGMNDIGTRHANQCLKSFEADGMPPIANLRAALTSSADRDTIRQRTKALERAVKTMEKRSATVAAYPDGMIDFPDAKTLKDSADCFRDEFKKVDAIVYKMDDILIVARKVLTEAKLRLKANK